jgi:hypothetical protein
MTGNEMSFTKLLENFSGEPATLLLYWVIPKDGSVGSSGSGGDNPQGRFFFFGMHPLDFQFFDPTPH